jgi:hypothetical protein
MMTGHNLGAALCASFVHHSVVCEYNTHNMFGLLESRVTHARCSGTPAAGHSRSAGRRSWTLASTARTGLVKTPLKIQDFQKSILHDRKLRFLEYKTFDVFYSLKKSRGVTAKKPIQTAYRKRHMRGFSQKQDMTVICDQRCTVLTSCVIYLSGL